jgi:hypothetical protein
MNWRGQCGEFSTVLVQIKLEQSHVPRKGVTKRTVQNTRSWTMTCPSGWHGSRRMSMTCTGCYFEGGGGMGPALMSGYWRYGGQMDQIYESIAQGRLNGMPTRQFVLQPQQMPQESTVRWLGPTLPCRALTAANGRRPMTSRARAAPNDRRPTPRRDKVARRKFRGPRPTGRHSTTNSRVARQNRARVPAASAGLRGPAALPRSRTRPRRTSELPLQAAGPS